MHKYRDGIIRRETGERDVKEVYILTPIKVEQVDGIRYFSEDFHEKYRMGAVQMVPGDVDMGIKLKILGLLRFSH